MKIAVTDCGKPEKQQQYIDWLRSFDRSTVIESISSINTIQHLEGYDGLVLSGGEDVDPELSKALPVEHVAEYNRKRDDFEFRMLTDAMKHRLPILGICRGMQLTNVFLGGTLIADLPKAGNRDHTAPKGEPELRHTVKVVDGTMMRTIAGSEQGEVNSYHHQSILNAAPDLLVSSRSDDGVIESMEWKDKAYKSFLLLVQWHPERMRDRENPMTHGIGSTFISEVQKKNIN